MKCADDRLSFDTSYHFYSPASSSYFYFWFTFYSTEHTHTNAAETVSIWIYTRNHYCFDSVFRIECVRLMQISFEIKNAHVQSEKNEPFVFILIFYQSIHK